MEIKITTFLLRFITVFLFFRVGITAIQDGSIFLFIIAVLLAVVFLNMPKLIKEIKI